jgi:hypothetical protein
VTTSDVSLELQRFRQAHTRMQADGGNYL